MVAAAGVEGKPVMDEDSAKGVGKQVTGSIKEAIGKVTGDTGTEADGAAEKTTGKAHNAAREARDTIRDAVKE